MVEKRSHVGGASFSFLKTRADWMFLLIVTILCIIISDTLLVIVLPRRVVVLP